MSTTVERPLAGTPPAKQPSTPSQPTHLVRWLVLAVVLLAAAVVTLGAWVVVDQTGTTGNDNQALVNDLANAWSTYDATAITTLYAPNAAITNPDGSSFAGIDAILGALGTYKLFKTNVEPIGKAAVNGDYTATFFRISDGTEVLEVLTLLQVKNGKIVRHWDFGPGFTPPLDNALAK
jgi:hypothetical protein